MKQYIIDTWKRTIQNSWRRNEKFDENSEYNKYKIGEEIILNQDFTKNDVS